MRSYINMKWHWIQSGQTYSLTKIDLILASNQAHDNHTEIGKNENQTYHSTV